jgi:hypothetical protein
VGLLVQGQEFNTTFLLSSSDPIIRSSDQQISRSADQQKMEQRTANSKQQTVQGTTQTGCLKQQISSVLVFYKLLL